MKSYQYITEGVLESYLLGTLSKEDHERATYLIATDPDLAIQLEELEVSMEHYLLENAVPPPPGVVVALQERLIGAEIQKREEKRHTQTPPRPEFSRSPYVDVEVSDTHIRVHKNWRVAFIAVFVLSKLLLAFGLYQYFKANSLEQKIIRLNTTQQTTLPPAQPR